MIMITGDKANSGIELVLTVLVPELIRTLIMIREVRSNGISYSVNIACNVILVLTNVYSVSCRGAFFERFVDSGT